MYSAEAREEMLRTDIRRLGVQLGESIQRNVSADFFSLVEKVRLLARSLRGFSAEGGGDPDAATPPPKQ